MMARPVDESPEEEGREQPAVLRVGALVLDRQRVQVTLGGVAVALTRTEFLFLVALMARAGEVVARPVLVGAAGGAPFAAEGRAVHSHVTRLRAKLRAAAARAGVPPPVIETVRGVGYRLRA